MNFANKDLWAGLSLILVGAVALYVGRDYPMGTTLRMGAGYFPVVLSSLLILFGLALVGRSFVSTELVASNWSPRALIILPIALAMFGVLIDRAGFIPAMLVLVFGSALAGREFKVLEVAALAVGLTVLCVAVFIYGLGLPYPLIAGY